MQVPGSSLCSKVGNHRTSFKFLSGSNTVGHAFLFEHLPNVRKTHDFLVSFNGSTDMVRESTSNLRAV